MNKTKPMMELWYELEENGHVGFLGLWKSRWCVQAAMKSCSIPRSMQNKNHCFSPFPFPTGSKDRVPKRAEVISHIQEPFQTRMDGNPRGAAYYLQKCTTINREGTFFMNGIE
jgi:hypothetical protein